MKHRQRGKGFGTIDITGLLLNAELEEAAAKQLREMEVAFEQRADSPEQRDSACAGDPAADEEVSTSPEEMVAIIESEMDGPVSPNNERSISQRSTEGNAASGGLSLPEGRVSPSVTQPNPEDSDQLPFDLVNARAASQQRPLRNISSMKNTTLGVGEHKRPHRPLSSSQFKAVQSPLGTELVDPSWLEEPTRVMPRELVEWTVELDRRAELAEQAAVELEGELGTEAGPEGGLGPLSSQGRRR